MLEHRLTKAIRLWYVQTAFTTHNILILPSPSRNYEAQTRDSIIKVKYQDIRSILLLMQ